MPGFRCKCCTWDANFADLESATPVPSGPPKAELEKPVEPRTFKILLERAIRYKRSLQKTDELKRELSLHGVLGDLVGTSAACSRRSGRWRRPPRQY